MSVGLMTQLEAVNRLLAATGDSPVQTLDENYQQSELALDTLNRVSRDLQSKGWYFNEEESVTLSKDVSDNVVLPANILSVMPTTSTYVQRGSKIYDKGNQTFVITEAVTADTIIQLEWDELPHPAREAIVAEASIVFYKDFFGSEANNNDLLRALDSALIGLRQADLDSRGTNLINRSRIQDIAFTNRN